MTILNSGFARGNEGGELADLGGGRQVNVNSGWFRGNDPRFRPVKPALLSPQAVKDFILDGWAPPAPVISKQTRVITFGSCFAGNIARHLEKAGFNLLSEGPREDGVFAVACNEGIVNTFTTRQLMEWVYEGKQPIEPLWRDADRLYAFNDAHRTRMRALFDRAEVFIITLGLSEVWYSKETGDVFSSSIPREMYDESKHGFRLSSVAENIANLEAVYRLLRQHAPEARFIFTLSPVPLLATFRPVSCISANTVSKAILRVAVDELCRKDDPRLHYWPSYEIVLEAFRDSFMPDNRHVREEVLAFIMALFEQVYCEGGPSDTELLSRFFEAVVACGQLSPAGQRALAAGGAPEQINEKFRRQAPEEAILLLRRHAIAHPSPEIEAHIEAIQTDLTKKTQLLIKNKRERSAQRIRAAQNEPAEAGPTKKNGHKGNRGRNARRRNGARQQADGTIAGKIWQAVQSYITRR